MTEHSIHVNIPGDLELIETIEKKYGPIPGDSIFKKLEYIRKTINGIDISIEKKGGKTNEF